MYLELTHISARNSAPLLSFLLNNGIRVLNYVGDADYLCNWVRYFLENEENSTKIRYFSMAFTLSLWNLNIRMPNSLMPKCLDHGYIGASNSVKYSL